MVDSADEARHAAASAAAALRLVNETAAEKLIAAVDRGETRAVVAIDAVPIVHASGRVGRLYDDRLIEALDESGARGLARACRIFSALGFHVATVPEVEHRADEALLVDGVASIRMTHVELGFATSVPQARSAAEPLLGAVALPAAHLWRSRAEVARRVDTCERKALALIAGRADRGEVACRLDWKAFGHGPPDARLLQQLAGRLGSRGFRVETLDSSAALQVSW